MKTRSSKIVNTPAKILILKQKRRINTRAFVPRCENSFSNQGTKARFYVFLPVMII
jgi:hypothetical protein